MKLDPKIASIVASSQQAAQQAVQQQHGLRMLHCQLMATLLAPMVAGQFASQSDKAEWGGDEMQLNVGPAMNLAGQMADNLMRLHGFGPEKST